MTFNTEKEYHTIATSINALSNEIDGTDDHKVLADITHTIKKSTDDLAKLVSELNKCKMRASVKAAKALIEDQERILIAGEKLPNNYVADTCTYTLKYDVSYRIDDHQRFSDTLTGIACTKIPEELQYVTPVPTSDNLRFAASLIHTLVSNRFVSSHFPNVCSVLDEQDMQYIPGAIIERFPTIVTRKRTVKEQESIQNIDDDVPF